MFTKTIVAAAAAAMLGAFGTVMAETKAEVKAENAVHKTAKATHHVAHKTVKATRHVAHKTAKATRHATHRAIPTVKDAPDYRASTTRDQRMAEARANWERTRRL